MKFNQYLIGLLLMSTLSAQAATLNYNIVATDSNQDSFVGAALYDTTLDIFTTITGKLSYADGNVSKSFSGYDQTYFSGYTGSTVGSAIFNVTWADGTFVNDFLGSSVVLLLDSVPNWQAAAINTSSFIVDDLGNQYQITTSRMSIPEPTLLTLLAAGLMGLGLSHRKLKD